MYFIYRTDGIFFLPVFTDINGTIRVSDLAPGNYEFLEVIAPRNYQINTTPIPFVITENQIKVLKITAKDDLITGSVVLTKTDGANPSLKLSGATFKLVDAQGSSMRQNLITDTNGKITVSGLRPGDYQFIETSPPSGYVLDTTPILLNIELSQASILKIKARDKKNKVSLEKNRRGN